MAALSDRDRDRFVASFDVERLLAGGKLAHVAVVLVVVLVDDLLQVQVLHVGIEVGEPPGDIGVVPDDDAGQPRERESRDVEGALGADLVAVQAHLVPGAGHGRPQVRVVRQDRSAARGVLARHGPGIGPEAVGCSEQPRQPALRLPSAQQRLLASRQEGGSVWQPGSVACGVLLEDSVNDRALVDDRFVLGIRVVGVELGDLLASQVDGLERAIDLVVHVATQVPGHRLEPGQGVFRRPLLGGVVEAVETKDGVLEGKPGTSMVSEIRVDPRRERLEIAAGVRREQWQLLLRNPSPAHGANELVGLEGVFAEHLSQPSRRHVAAKVHLEEAVLGLYVALPEEEVLAGVGVDLRDAVVVADHGDLGVQTLDGDRSARVRKRLVHCPDSRDKAGDEQQDDPDTHPAQDTQPTGHPPHCAGDNFASAGWLPHNGRCWQSTPSSANSWN